MGLADFYNQNGCADIESKIKALEHRLKQHPWNGMDRKKRLMLLEKEYCKMGAFHQDVKQQAGKDDFKNAYEQMMNDQSSAYNQFENLDPKQMAKMNMMQGVQFYGREYYQPR